jgi:hypothetical protein
VLFCFLFEEKILLGRDYMWEMRIWWCVYSLWEEKWRQEVIFQLHSRFDCEEGKARVLMSSGFIDSSLFGDWGLAAICSSRASIRVKSP